MTSIVDFLVSSFDCTSQTISIEEKYSEFNFKCSLASLDCVNARQLEKINNYVYENDFWRLVLLIGQNDPISLSKNSLNLESFEEQLEQEREYIGSEECWLTLRVEKDVFSQSVAIYDFDAFDCFVGAIGTRNFLDVIKDRLDKGCLKFIPFDGHNDCFYSEKISFGVQEKNLDEGMRVANYIEPDTPYTFRDQATYPYNPSFFRLIKEPSSHSNISNKLAILEGVFEIVRIFSLSWFDDSTLFYRLDGYKSINGQMNLDSEPLDSRDVYWKIYEWIHSEKGSVVDKLGIARNVISIYLSGESLSLPEDAYFSTQSAFRTYLQKNLDRYIAIREKLNDQLSTIVQKVDDLMKEYIEGFQKSSLLFVSFFISVFLAKILSSGGYQDVFTKDATVLSFAFLFISFLYLCLLSWNVNRQAIRLRRRYQSLKSRFGDLLIEQDIEKILKNDEEFNSEMSFFKKRRLLIAVVWFTTIIVFLCTTITLSSYINWELLASSVNWEFIKKVYR